MAAFGELEASGLAELRQHLASCVACAEQAREIEASRRLVATAEGHPLPPAFSAPAPGSRRLLQLAAAAVILLAILGVALTWRGSGDDISVEPRLASGAVGASTMTEAAATDASFGDDGFGDEIESLQSELSSLESKVGEF